MVNVDVLVYRPITFRLLYKLQASQRTASKEKSSHAEPAAPAVLAATQAMCKSQDEKFEQKRLAWWRRIDSTETKLQIEAIEAELRKESGRMDEDLEVFRRDPEAYLNQHST